MCQEVGETFEHTVYSQPKCTMHSGQTMCHQNLPNDFMSHEAVCLGMGVSLGKGAPAAILHRSRGNQERTQVVPKVGLFSWKEL